MKKLRIHQFLTQTGIFRTKTDVFKAIEKGEIKIDGVVTRTPSFQFKPGKKIITYREKPIEMKTEKKYIIFYKPEGYLSHKLTQNDRIMGKKSMFELIPKDNTLFSAGRLDEDSEGLIIVTNDGKIARKLIRPEKDIEKTYEAALEKNIEDKDIKKLEQGVTINIEYNGEIKQFQTKPAKIKKISPRVVHIKITEGRKRQVRKMLEAVNNRVIKLKRIAIGNIQQKDLRLIPGKHTEVNKEWIEERLHE